MSIFACAGDFVKPANDCLILGTLPKVRYAIC